MKKSLLPLAVLVFVAAVFLTFLSPVNTVHAQNAELAIGAGATLTDVEVEDVSGEMLTLQEVAGENGLPVNFSCNICPWVERWEDRYNPIAKLARENGSGVIALNPNSAIRDRGEDMGDMKERAKSSGYEFYYALDKDSKNCRSL